VALAIELRIGRLQEGRLSFLLLAAFGRGQEAGGLFVLRPRTAVERFDRDPDFGEDPRLLAGVQRVVDGFLYRGQQGLARVVEAEQVAVLREELADRDLLLLRGHTLGGLAGLARLSPDGRRSGRDRGAKHAWDFLGHGP
jgi:hypothetical protein